jgi:hypothetical protein
MSRSTEGTQRARITACISSRPCADTSRGTPCLMGVGACIAGGEMQPAWF